MFKQLNPILPVKELSLIHIYQHFGNSAFDGPYLGSS